MLEKYSARYFEQLELSGQRLTSPAWRYLHEDTRLTSFLRLVLRVVNDASEAARQNEGEQILQQLKAGTTVSMDVLDKVLHAATDSYEIASYGDLVAQMELTRMVDNFLAYLSASFRKSGIDDAGDCGRRQQIWDCRSTCACAR